jgi:hypothetical protein
MQGFNNFFFVGLFQKSAAPPFLKAGSLKVYEYLSFFLPFTLELSACSQKGMSPFNQFGRLFVGGSLTSE